MPANPSGGGAKGSPGRSLPAIRRSWPRTGSSAMPILRSKAGRHISKSLSVSFRPRPARHSRSDSGSAAFALPSRTIFADIRRGRTATHSGRRQLDGRFLERGMAYTDSVGRRPRKSGFASRKRSQPISADRKFRFQPDSRRCSVGAFPWCDAGEVSGCRASHHQRTAGHHGAIPGRAISVPSTTGAACRRIGCTTSGKRPAHKDHAAKKVWTATASWRRKAVRPPMGRTLRRRLRSATA